MATQINIPNVVSYNEVALLHNKTATKAARHLSIIRSIAGKKRYQPLYVAEFCQHEGISVEFYHQQLTEAYNRFNKTAS